MKHKMQVSPNISIVPTEILWIEGEVNYSRLYFRNRLPLLLCCTLKELENKLNKKYSFIRVHRGYLVNEEHLNKVDLLRREVQVDHKVIPIARRRLPFVGEIIINSISKT